MTLNWLSSSGGIWGARKLRFQIDGEGTSRSFTLPAAGVVWLGRDAECQVVLPTQQVSRKHLSIFASQGNLYVRDQSAYGTRVQGQLVHGSVRRLPASALLELGPYKVWVSVTGAGLDWASQSRSRSALAGLLGLAALVGLAWWAVRAPVQPQLVAAACAVEPAVAPSGAQLPQPVTVLHAVELLRAKHKPEALALYRALSARDDSPAPLSVVAGLLAYELSCPR
jgi:predicted component of type VI protein secretion system